jgi:DNA-binding CsgD family transcriptional regulator
MEVARLVAQGKTNREIGADLFLSPRTVDTHVEHIITKLEIRSRSQIAGWLAKQRMVAAADCKIR